MKKDGPCCPPEKFSLSTPTSSSTTPPEQTRKSITPRAAPGPAPAARSRNSGTRAADPPPLPMKLAQLCYAPMEPCLPPAPTPAVPPTHQSSTPIPENGLPAQTSPAPTAPPTDQPRSSPAATCSYSPVPAASIHRQANSSNGTAPA